MCLIPIIGVMLELMNPVCSNKPIGVSSREILTQELFDGVTSKTCILYIKYFSSQIIAILKTGLS